MKPEFSRAEVLRCVPGLSPQTFESWVLRGILDLADATDLGSGNRRRYSGEDVLQIAAVYELGRQGVTPARAAPIWSILRGHIIRRMTAPPGEPQPRMIGVFSVDERNEQRGLVCEERYLAGFLTAENMPDVAVILCFDTFLDRVLVRINEVYSTRQARPDLQDFFRHWVLDGKGRRVLVGLTFDESAELQRLQAADRRSRKGPGSVHVRARMTELRERHELARMQRIALEYAEPVPVKA